MQGESLYRAMLWCYPPEFRREYGREMLLVFAQELVAAGRSGGLRAEAAIWFRTAADILTVAPKEHMHMIRQDLRYAIRTLAASPGFVTVAVLSLALGIGANTAMFSLLNGVLLSALPVRQPEQLVILSDPDSSGVSIGSETGDRSLLTYAEYEQLRGAADVFSGVMAAQSSLDRWQIRVAGGDPEEVRGRMVSGEYFNVLGVTPWMGRMFSGSDDRTPGAVISYDYWQRRFGASPDVIGKAVTIRKAPLTIIGVAPAGFFGETAGQRPDLWAPLSMQPGILPGRDWLHDAGSDKVMWLHVFARLQAGVTIPQAQARANVIFKNGLEALYGSVVSAEARRGFLNQRLLVRPASTGASNVRTRFSDPMRVLLGVAAVVLLIACANLGNLLLARGAARKREIALRLSLGAGRGRVVQQLLTESLVLAAVGGLAGLATAYLLHRGLVRMAAAAVDTFRVDFRLDWRVLAFAFAVTLASALVFGLVPALRATRADVNADLKEHARAATSTAGQLRWGRLLVAGQIALSLPLLVGAGLLLRTLHNLQNADLGYPRERLLLVRVDAQTAGYDAPRRPVLFRELLDRIRGIPGVRSASFSENGVFSGRESGDEILVEGYTRKGDKDRGSRWDQVGPGYFSTMGIPILLGREINDADQTSSTKVCVINEAFAKVFFVGRNPIGMHITTVYGDKRTIHRIAGVAADARTQRLRAKVDPRYFVPATQDLAEFDSVSFEIRTTREPGLATGAVRQAMQSVDPNLPVMSSRTLEDQVAERTATDRLVAQLTVIFGAVALMLSAVGLYGVLSYGVTRRRSEIGIRIALGALPRRVVAMILRETVVVVGAGLAIGAGLAAASARIVSSQLYGLEPTDPATFSAAIAMLAAVAFTAAYVPAHRASRVDPMSALREE